jgi:hypothetical protein
MSRYTSAKHRPSFTFDAELEFKDAGLIAADAAATVDSVAKIVDLGEGLVEGNLIIDVTAIEIASNDERYEIQMQFSDSSSFASGVVGGATQVLGALEVLIGTDTDSTTGRYVLPFRNEVNGTWYRYARVYTNVAGAIATGINYVAWAAKR